MDENKKTKKTTNKKDSKSKQSKTNPIEQERRYWDYITKQVAMMSPENKLYVLREAIDLVALGQKVDQNVINMCYTDLCNDLSDYRFLQDEYNEDYQQIQAELGLTGDENGNYSIPKSPEDIVRDIAGDKYDDLLDGLDTINQKEGTALQVYLYPNNKTRNVKIKIWDDREGTLKRVYDDPYDLMLNYEQDIESNFTKPKKHDLPKVKPLSENKKENRED